VRINNTVFTVEVAATSAAQERGLSYRNSLPTNAGMLFVYSTPSRYPFWMHEMRFALDFIWIDNNQVIDLSENIPPPSQTNNQPTILSPRAPVRYILEVNAVPHRGDLQPNT
jgi:uncharacterized membrane protein (UPF0127 family)